jgi:NaMN:DMB phosphoribosyltransferase
VSSSYIDNPVLMKEEVWRLVAARLQAGQIDEPLGVVRVCGDPMIALAAGIATSYPGTLILAGGTQMLSVAAVVRAMGSPVPWVATTCYVRDDPSANFAGVAEQAGVRVTYVDPAFGDLGHAGLARYCIGEVKEGWVPGAPCSSPTCWDTHRKLSGTGSSGRSRPMDKSPLMGGRSSWGIRIVQEYPCFRHLIGR